MAEEASAAGVDPAGWRGRGVSILALVAAIVLIALIGLVTLTNRNRGEALGLERNTYEVMQLARTVDATIARGEAAMGRYVLDESRATGSLYYQEWRTASRQIGQLRELVANDPEQRQRVDDLRRHFDQRGRELATAADAAFRRQGLNGIGYFFQAASSETLPRIRGQLDAIVRGGRNTLQQRVGSTEAATDQADRLTQWLGWVAVLISALAIALSYWAYRATAEGRVARSEADSEAERAGELERAVQDRTRELSTAYERLQAETDERAAAEEKLRQMQKMEAVGALTGGIAHDFNNMLAVVVGGLDLARRKLKRSPEEAEPHIENAMEGATRAAALTRRLLAFARAEPLLPEAIAPADLVHGMLELIDRTIGERVRVHTKVPDDHWPVWADPTGLENVILNLCVNARDAMAETGDLTIEVANVSIAAGEIGELPAGEFVRLSVTDTGCGISPEHLERVFEPFFTTKPVGKGTGLGLSQIFGFARQSGGEVTIASEVGAGTNVSIYLPRAIGVVERAAAPFRQPAAGPALPPGGDCGARILVVEDDPRVSRSTVTALVELGHTPIAVASAREALATLAEDDAFDLVVTDVVMPEMTGVELAQELGRRHPHLRILFVTGYVGEAGSHDELAGADLLRKPFTVAQLSIAVDAALQGARRYDTAAE
jgi:signal transduction histidine kinase